MFGKTLEFWTDLKKFKLYKDFHYNGLNLTLYKDMMFEHLRKIVQLKVIKSEISRYILSQINEIKVLKNVMVICSIIKESIIP